jgi:hypothetical protein
MDLDHVKAVIEKELQSHKGLLSLTLQNHIYGCFIIAEDLSLKSFTLEPNDILVGSKVKFSLKKQFPVIGLRFGFVLDTKLRFTASEEYCEVWMEIFRYIAKNCDNPWVDTFEDLIIEVIRTAVEPCDAFFINALDTGSLTQEWVERAIVLLVGEEEGEGEEGEEEKSHTGLTEANTEKVVKKPLKSIMKPLAITQRRREEPKNKKNFAYTRRVRISVPKE